MSTGAQDPPPVETFPQYDVDGPGAPMYRVLVINERAGRQDNTAPSGVTDPLTEEQALAFVESVAQRQQQEWVEIGDDDLVLQVSPGELLVHRPSYWMGDRLTRVVAGRIR